MDDFNSGFYLNYRHHMRCRLDFKTRIKQFFDQLTNSKEDTYKRWGLYDAVIGNVINKEAFLHGKNMVNSKTNYLRENPYLEGLKYIDLVLGFKKTRGNVNTIAQELFKENCNAIPAYNSIKELYDAVAELDKLNDYRDDDEPQSKRKCIK